MWHYMIVNINDGTDVPLDSSRHKEFNGWETKEKAHYSGLMTRIDNKLSHTKYRIITYIVYNPAIRKTQIVAKIEGIKENNTLSKDMSDIMDDILTDLKY